MLYEVILYSFYIILLRLILWIYFTRFWCKIRLKEVKKWTTCSYFFENDKNIKKNKRYFYIAIIFDENNLKTFCIYKVRDIDADTVQIDYETTVEEKRGVNRAIETIINYVKSENIKNITRKELVSKFSDIPETTIKKALTGMVQLGLFEATGSTKDRVYKPISPKIEPNKL